MVNSVDPDQTAPSGAVWSGSALFALGILLGILLYKIVWRLMVPQLKTPKCHLKMYERDHFAFHYKKVSIFW